MALCLTNPKIQTSKRISSRGHIFGRNLFWYAAVFGTITAISRAAISDELLVLDPVGTMTSVVQHTRYMPKRWRGKEKKDDVRLELETLFQYTGMMLLDEIASIFITPFLLMFVVLKVYFSSSMSDL